MTTKEMTFGGLLALALRDDRHPAAEYVEGSDTFARTPHGAELRLGTQAFAIIGADDVAGTDVRGVTGRLDWPIERATAILDLLTVFEVAEKRGRVPVGTRPAVTMQAESATAGSDADPGISDVEYHTASVVEAKSSYTTQLVLQAAASLDISAAIEASHRAAIRQALLRQIVNGDGQGNDLSGILGQSGIGSATYAQADRGAHPPFLVAEAAVEDEDSDPATSAWLLGSDLSDSARSAAIEPGSYRRTEERGRISLSGYRSFRSDSAIPGTTGLLCDWASVALVMQDSILVTVDRYSRPGEVRLTSRLAVADPIVTRAARVYKLEQA